MFPKSCFPRMTFSPPHRAAESSKHRHHVELRATSDTDAGIAPCLKRRGVRTHRSFSWSTATTMQRQQANISPFLRHCALESNIDFSGAHGLTRSMSLMAVFSLHGPDGGQARH